MLHAFGVIIIKQLGEMGAQEFHYLITQRLNDQAVFFVAEIALFHGLGKDAAVQFIVCATNTPPWHVLFGNVSAFLYFMHEAGKRGGAPDAALFQHADEGRLRVVRLQIADVHARLQFVILYAGIGHNRLQQRPAVGRVICFSLRSRRHNAPARKLGAFH